MTIMQRVLLAWLAAALMPGIALSLYLFVTTFITDSGLSGFIGGTLAVSLIIFVIASLHILILGLPIFYKLETRGILNIWTASAGGLLIAGTPVFIITLASEPLSWSSIWASTILSYALLGPFGLVGGISAWGVWRYTAPKTIDINANTVF